MKEEPIDKMQMIRNKMLDARRAMDRDQASVTKAKKDPSELFKDVKAKSCCM